jgi:ABC-2 type transport system ATP-binding protein
MSIVVETRGLTKRYEQAVAVDNLDIRVRRGEVYGFLGPNGAGKTTTLRMLLGLVRPSAGSATVLGAAPGSAEGLAGVGAMIEGSAFYPYLSGRDNLRVVARYAGVDESRVAAALDQVQLTGRAGDRFASYSMGMKQRLGLGAALLKDPELLILDEPTNGLDPAGMADMRRLVRELAEAGRTVLLSSHLMGEVEHVCDRVAVIRKGVLIAEGTLDELRGEPQLHLRVEPVREARAVLDSHFRHRVEAAAGGDGELRVFADPADAAAINRTLVESGVAVAELRAVQPSLEDVFLELTHK